jgi:hypothetical protein
MKQKIIFLYLFNYETISNDKKFDKMIFNVRKKINNKYNIKKYL